MLYIVAKRPVGKRVGLSPTLDYTWHIGEAIPPLDPESVMMVQADGDELMHIIANFANVPYPKHKRVVVWASEMARFIYRHL